LPLAAMAGWALIGAGVVTALCIWKGWLTAACLALAMSMIVPLGLAARGLTIMAPFFSLAPITVALQKPAPAQAVVVCEGEPDASASLFFYLHRPVAWVGARWDAEFVPRHFHLGLEHYLGPGEFIELWHSSRQVFLICEGGRQGYLQEKLGPTVCDGQVLAKSGTRILIANHPTK